MQTISPAKDGRVIVAYAKFKLKDPISGQWYFLEGTKRYPIQAKPDHAEREIQAFVRRMIKKRNSPFSRADLYCFIEDTNRQPIATYLGGFPHNMKHRSAFRLQHLNNGTVEKTLFTNESDEMDMEKAPWELINRYKPKGKQGNIRVYDRQGNIVVRFGKRMEWQNGNRRP